MPKGRGRAKLPWSKEKPLSAEEEIAILLENPDLVIDDIGSAFDPFGQNQKPKRRNKFNNRRTVVDGIQFDSKREANRYSQLRAMERQGEIRELETQPKYELQPSFRRGGKTIRAITYKPDFFYIRVSDGAQVAEDVKSSDRKATLTDGSNLRMKMFQYHYPDIEFYIV